MLFFRRKFSNFKDLSDLAATGSVYEIGDPIWKRQVLSADCLLGVWCIT